MNNLEPKGNEEPCVALITICERGSPFYYFSLFGLEKHFSLSLHPFSFQTIWHFCLTWQFWWHLITISQPQIWHFLEFVLLLLFQKVEPNIWICAPNQPKWLEKFKRKVHSINLEAVEGGSYLVIIFYCKISWKYTYSR